MSLYTCMYLYLCMYLYSCMQLYESGLDSLLTLTPSVWPCCLTMPAVSSTECGCGLDPSLLHVTLDHVFNRHLSVARLRLKTLFSVTCTETGSSSLQLLSSAAGMQGHHGSMGCCQKGLTVHMHLYVSARPDTIAFWLAGRCVLGK